MKLFLKYLADVDDSYEKSKMDGIDWPLIPRTNEVIEINGYFHAIVAVVHSLEEGSVTLHLGHSSQSPAEAQQWAQSADYPESYQADSSNEID